NFRLADQPDVMAGSGLLSGYDHQSAAWLLALPRVLNIRERDLSVSYLKGLLLRRTPSLAERPRPERRGRESPPSARRVFRHNGQMKVEVGALECYSWSPSHDQCGMLRPFGTSSADW